MTMRVELAYFKTSGKHYTDSSYQTNLTEFYSIVGEVQDKLLSGTLPGLAEGAREFIIHVTIPDHPLGGSLPHLLIPDSIKKAGKS